MPGFESPNYTQTPNDLFDRLLPEMGEAELKVTLALIRLTFGWHTTRARASISYLMQATGLSNRHVIAGSKAAIERGTFKKFHNRTGSIYELVIVTKSDNDALGSDFRSQANDENDASGSELRSHNKEKDTDTLNKREGLSHDVTNQRDPNLRHPGVVSYRSILHITANRLQRKSISETVTDFDLWTGTLIHWAGHGWSKFNVTGMLDMYSKGGPASCHLCSGNGRQNVPTWKRPTQHSEDEDAAFARLNPQLTSTGETQ